MQRHSQEPAAIASLTASMSGAKLSQRLPTPANQHSATPAARMASGTARSALAQLSALCRRRDTSGTLPSAWMLSREPRRGMPSLPESESCRQHPKRVKCTHEALSSMERHFRALE